jgi:hypothetical protein
MAKMKRPIGDLVSGKIGNVVFVNIKNKSYVRSAPTRKKDGWSEQQILYRQRLGKIAKLWRSIASEPVKQAWNQVSTEMNGYASFVKANMPALEIDGKLIDPALLTVTEGKLVNPQLLKAEREDQFPGRVKVSWQNDKNSKKERLEDALMALTFADNHFSPLTDTGIKRGDQSGSFTLPLPYPDTAGKLTLFLFMKSNDNSQVSRSISFGMN